MKRPPRGGPHRFVIRSRQTVEPSAAYALQEQSYYAKTASEESLFCGGRCGVVVVMMMMMMVVMMVMHSSCSWRHCGRSRGRRGGGCWCLCLSERRHRRNVSHHSSRTQ
jgi:hypothetical protein